MSANTAPTAIIWYPPKVRSSSANTNRYMQTIICAANRIRTVIALKLTKNPMFLIYFQIKLEDQDIKCQRTKDPHVNSFTCTTDICLMKFSDTGRIETSLQSKFRFLIDFPIGNVIDSLEVTLTHLRWVCFSTSVLGSFMWCMWCYNNGIL